jgi:hypothetical protein
VVNSLILGSVAAVGFVVAYFAGWILYMATGVSSEDGSGVVFAALVCVLWLLLAGFVNRWWSLALPLAFYVLYVATSKGAIHYASDDVVTLEQWLAVATASMGLGVAVRRGLSRAASVRRE